VKIDTVISIIARSFALLTKREKRNIFFVIIIQIILGLLDLLSIIMLGLLGSLAINGISSQNIGDKTKIALNLLNISDKSLQEQALYLGIIATALLISKTIFSLYFTKKSLYFLSKRAAHLSSELISKLLSQSLLVVQEKSVQQNIYMVTTGVTTITVGIIGSIVYLISDFSLLIILLSGLFFVDPLIAFTTLILFSFVATVLYRVMHKKMEKFGQEQSILSIESAEKINEVITSYRELFVKDRREYYSKEIGNLRYKLASAMAENTFYQNISKYVLEITMVLGALFISAVQFSTQSASRAVAVMSIFLVSSARIGPAVLRIQQVFLNIKTSIGASLPTLELIENLNSLDTGSISGVVNDQHAEFFPEVFLKDVSFKYPLSKSFVLSNVTIKLKPGTITSIVGPSGAGKTTLVDLILGVLNPDSGIVTISGEKPAVAIKKWPTEISYVPQDVVITNGTIQENVTLGYPANETDAPAVINALKIAQLNDFVSTLPNNLNTKVGDRGTKISGGQRQRLGISRAMFTKPSLLILDEATSSLDGATEANISDSILKMRGTVTVIMIAHRLSTVRSSDLVIYLDKGKILATGNFEEVRSIVPDFDKQAKLMGL